MNQNLLRAFHLLSCGAFTGTSMENDPQKSINIFVWLVHMVNVSSYSSDTDVGLSPASLNPFHIYSNSLTLKGFLKI